MLNTCKTMTGIKQSVIAALVGVGTLATLPSNASAMVVHNCTDRDFSLIMQGKGAQFRGSVAARGTAQIHTPKGFGPYRIVLPALGPGGWFSNRAWNETVSLTQISGNIGIARGNACAKPVINPDEYRTPPGHFQWCESRYRSYRRSDNTFQPFGDQPRRECMSPYL